MKSIIYSKCSSNEYIYPIKIISTFLIPFKTLWENVKSKELGEEVKNSFIIPMAKNLQTRFTIFNRTDFEEISKMDRSFIDVIEFYFSMAGISALAVKEMLSDCKNYLSSDFLPDKLKGIELLSKELQLDDLGNPHNYTNSKEQ